MAAGDATGPNSSHLHSLDSQSQICGGSPDLRSFPSQPPDVRNWFSSYHYESPECSALPCDLDSYFLLDESGTQDPLGSLGELRHEVPTGAKDTYFLQSHRLIPDGNSLFSIGDLLSESSPEAESLLSNQHETRFQKFGVKSPGEYNNHCDDSISDNNALRVDGNQYKGQGQSSKRLSGKTKCKLPRLDDLLDEVPGEEDSKLRCNVGKDGYIPAKNKENIESDLEDILSKVASRAEDEGLLAQVENRRETTRSLLTKKYLAGSESRGHSENLLLESFPNNNGALCSKKKQKLDLELGVEFSYKNSEDGDSLLFRRTNRSQIKAHECTSQAQFGRTRSKDCLDEKDLTRVYYHTPPESNIISKDSNVTSQHKKFCQNFHDEEQRENGGFICIRNKGISKGNGGNLTALNPKEVPAAESESRGKESHGNLTENTGALHRKEYVQARTRSALTDRTNVQEGAAAVATEIPGKWKCPRRSKPYVGPPLKQLRLERWVQRGN